MKTKFPRTNDFINWELTENGQIRKLAQSASKKKASSGLSQKTQGNV